MVYSNYVNILFYRY